MTSYKQGIYNFTQYNFNDEDIDKQVELFNDEFSLFSPLFQTNLV